MSQKIRQGNDIRIRWSILDADEHPYILEGRNVAVELNVGTKRVRIKSLEIESNVLIFTYYGKDQKYTGSYILKFIENEGQVDMVTFDTKDAFTLVEHSWQAIDEGETPETVQLEFVTVSSELMEKVGPAGPHFTPAVDGEGNLSWTNNGGLPNPETVNIKGPKGDDAAVVPGEGQKSAQQRESGAVASGEGAFAEGDGVASGAYSHAEGFGTESYEDYSHAEGYNTSADGAQSHAEGAASVASGDSAHAEGNTTVASGASSHSEGSSTAASGLNSHAEGLRSAASGDNAHAEGLDTRATSNSSHAEGRLTAATEQNAHAEGYQTVASGVNAHAEGRQSTASAQNSHAEGRGTEATHNEGEHAEGKWNKSNADTISSVGIGTSANDRKNAVEVMKNGDMYVKGVGGYDGTNPGAAQDLALSISRFITKSVNDLANYYLKSETYTRAEVDAALANYTTTDDLTASLDEINNEIESINERVIDMQPSFHWTDSFIWDDGLIWPSKESGGGDVDVDVIKLLHSAPTFSARGRVKNGNLTYYVDHPLSDMDGSEIVLLRYAKRNGKKHENYRGTPKKGYCVAVGSSSQGNYFTFSKSTRNDELYDFLSESGLALGYHFGLALRIPNPEWTWGQTIHKNATREGISESLWSDVLPISICYDSENDNYGIGLI